MQVMTVRPPSGGTTPSLIVVTPLRVFELFIETLSSITKNGFDSILAGIVLC